MIRATSGDTVTVQYTGRLADGTVFDASPTDRPLSFILGKGEVIPGFDEGVTDMYSGEKKTFTIPPDQAYGAREETYVEEVPRDMFPKDLPLIVGHQLEVTNEAGDKLLVMVADVTDDSVILDGNHPLAGKELTFEVELLKVHKLPPESKEGAFAAFTPPDRS
jgi:peptidylprolyl isomerase